LIYEIFIYSNAFWKITGSEKDISWFKINC
jgi:hypothetical protein